MKKKIVEWSIEKEEEKKKIKYTTAAHRWQPTYPFPCCLAFIVPAHFHTWLGIKTEKHAYELVLLNNANMLENINNVARSHCIHGRIF